MIADAAASTDDHVHEEEFVCLYLDDVCEEVELEDTDIQAPYYKREPARQWNATRLNAKKLFGQLHVQKTDICTQATKSLPFQSSFQMYSAF